MGPSTRKGARWFTCMGKTPKAPGETAPPRRPGVWGAERGEPRSGSPRVSPPSLLAGTRHLGADQERPDLRERLLRHRHRLEPLTGRRGRRVRALLLRRGRVRVLLQRRAAL